MSDQPSAESEEWTPASPEPDSHTSSSARSTSGDASCSPNDSPKSPSTTTYETSALTPSALISFAEDSPAKTSQSQDSDEGSCMKEVAPISSSSSPASQMSLFSPEGGSSLRTYPDFFPQTTDEISPSFSRRWPSSGFTTSLGECWTADTSESPNGGVGSSSLADVLEADVPLKYFLSPKAATGILRRAMKRGRELPTHLSQALEAVARTTTTPKRDES